MDDDAAAAETKLHEAPSANDSPLYATTPVAGDPAASQRPEVLLGAAFVGGFLLARILKRRGD